MKIIAASDLHLDEQHAITLIRAAESADLVIVAGDFAQRRQGLADYMARFEPIAAKMVTVPGNNETAEELRAATSAIVLHGEVIDVDGLAIAGIGGAVPPLNPTGWAGFELTEDEAATMLSKLGRADILISHSPPKGFGDWHHAIGPAMGSTAVGAAIERLQPQLFLCGHVHDSWGARAQMGPTLMANLGPVPVTFEVTP